jgi:hypothetical protein
LRDWSGDAGYGLDRAVQKGQLLLLVGENAGGAHRRDCVEKDNGPGILVSRRPASVIAGQSGEEQKERPFRPYKIEQTTLD